jgi:GNAT superfamily N-acetyltransferase
MPVCKIAFLTCRKLLNFLPQAMLDDPKSPAIFRRSGELPYPDSKAALPSEITFRRVTLRDGVTKATLVPYNSSEHVPPCLLTFLCKTINKEIEMGDSYPMIDPMAQEFFGPYWFANFAAVMLLGEYKTQDEVTEAEGQGKDWGKQCLGTFYIKPNYPGRSSHVCNAGFLVTEAARNKGVGKLMGEAYLQWAPKLVCANGILSHSLQLT